MVASPGFGRDHLAQEGSACPEGTTGRAGAGPTEPAAVPTTADLPGARPPKHEAGSRRPPATQAGRHEAAAQAGRHEAAAQAGRHEAAAQAGKPEAAKVPGST